MLTFPAIYTVASDASARAQFRYLLLIRAEYAVLFFASILELDFSESHAYAVVYAALFIAGMAFLLFRSTSKPEQGWYKSRALAESIKTSTWRYAMRAEPYGANDSENHTRREFRDNLSSILKTNSFLGDESSGKSVGDQQVTAEMDKIRLLAWRERQGIYLHGRVKDQLTWYSAKAIQNRNYARIWTGIGVLVYAAGILSVILKVAYPHFKYWPQGPLIVVASALVGWVQIKRFRELASSYSLTALEISIIMARLEEINDEKEFVEFVNDAEQGFSREHTQWVARQQRNA